MVILVMEQVTLKIVMATVERMYSMVEAFSDIPTCRVLPHSMTDNHSRLYLPK
jgi:hypothetical protein